MRRASQKKFNFYSFCRCFSLMFKGVGEGSNKIDFISQISDDILVMILARLPIKDAVVTSCLSTRWRFLWCNLNQLNFDSNDETFDKIAKNQRVYVSERSKFINQVNSVIQSYKHPIVHVFRVHFDLNNEYQSVIDEWPHFATNKKVETLELVFMDNCHKVSSGARNYNWPSSNAPTFMSLKQLILTEVNVTESNLEEFLSNSPHLETLSIQGSIHLMHIRVGGRTLNLKHFEIVKCYSVKSIYLSDFDLVSFAHDGNQPIDLRLSNLPKLRKLEIGQRLNGLENNVFNQISWCASSLVVLSLLGLYSFKENFELDSLPELPNVKKLNLTIGAHEDDSLLEFTSIAQVCPSMESFTITLLHFRPIIKREASHVASDYPHEHLKFFQFLGYFGRIRDLEFATYMMNNSVALEKIVIDPRLQGWKGSSYADDFLMIDKTDFLNEEEVARSWQTANLKLYCLEDWSW